MEKCIYMDNAATTMMYDEAKEEMSKYLCDEYGNPSSLYGLGRQARETVEFSRYIIANSIGANPNEIYFTSGGTESDNWAIKNIPFVVQNKNQIITSMIEHHAVLDSCAYMEQSGYNIKYIPVDEYGVVKLNSINKSISEETALITIMYANNEVGTIQPVREISRLAKENNIIFHSDAVQAYGHVPINVHEMGIDMMSASAHKFGGPKGVGYLYINKKIKMPAWIHGGGQEMGMRSGTENVAGIAAMGVAAKISCREMMKHMKRERNLREYFINRINKELSNVKINGHRRNRLSNNINVSFKNAEGKELLEKLNQCGICASAGSACSAGNLQPSYVLEAMNVPKEYANATIRFSISFRNTYNEINDVIECLKNNL